AALAIDQLWQRAAAADGDALCGSDGRLGDAWTALQAPGLGAKRPISQSALNILLGCPHPFLLEPILYLDDPPFPASTDVIPAIDYGSLFHAAAERFFRAHGAALGRREQSLEHWTAFARSIAAEEFDVQQYRYPMRGRDGIERERNRLLRQIEQL